MTFKKFFWRNVIGIFYILAFVLIAFTLIAAIITPFLTIFLGYDMDWWLYAVSVISALGSIAPFVMTAEKILGGLIEAWSFKIVYPKKEDDEYDGIE